MQAEMGASRGASGPVPLGGRAVHGAGTQAETRRANRWDEAEQLFSSAVGALVSACSLGKLQTPGGPLAPREREPAAFEPVRGTLRPPMKRVQCCAAHACADARKL